MKERKKQKKGKNSISKKIDMINQVNAKTKIVPPCGLLLDYFEQQLWDTFISSRQPSDWQQAHLILLYNFVKTQSDLLAERELYKLEKSIVFTDKGTPIANPRIRIISDLARLSISQARPLALDASPSDVKTIKSQSKEYDDVKSKMASKVKTLLA